MGQVLEYIKIALMNIRSNKGRSFLTMLGVIIGISSVIMIITIGNGVKSGVNDGLDSIAGGQIYLYSYGDNESGISIEFTQDDMDALLETVPNIKGVTPSYGFSGSAIAGRGRFQAYVTAGNDNLQYAKQEPLIKGRYFTENDFYKGNKVCVIEESGAKTLFGTANVVGMTLELSLYGDAPEEYTIVGIRQNPANSLLSMAGTTEINLEIPLSARGWWYTIDYSDILVISDGAENASQVAADCVRILENRHNVRGKDAIRVENFADYMGQISEVLDIVTFFIVFVAGISLLVGGIGVMNIMLVSVSERTREIGIRKALGARTGSILLQFLAESAIITLLGGIIGILFGVFLAAIVCNLISFPVKVDVGTILISTFFSTAVGVFFGIYPARKAAKLSPIEALRHE